MAEQKKRGFHALEQRIHQIEEEDAKDKQQPTSQPEQQRSQEQRRAEPGQPKPRK